jgi:hypothetical protein
VPEVLLVEFAATDRFHRAVRFPYVFGALRRLAVSTRWLRYAVPAAVQYLHGELGVVLDATELGVLARAARELEATHVVFGSQPAQTVVRAVRLAVPSARIGVLGGTTFADEDLDSVDDDLAAILGQDTDGRPDFGYEAANDAARTTQPLPFLSIGPECTYDRPLWSNPHYREVDLGDCVRPAGCAFCARPAWDFGTRLDADAVRRHVAALIATLPAREAPEARVAVRLVGEAALHHLEVLVDAFRGAGFAPTDLLLDSRADRLVKSESRLAEAATALVGTGHRLHVALVGIESFSRVELARMNKGTTPALNLAAVATLLRLEHEHPETFSLREHGGLSLILLTPWTVLEDLAFNLRLARACGLDGLSGKVYGSRLRLEPALPITALARRDQAILDRYEDPAFDTAARNLYTREVPWRFLDPRVEGVCRRLVRLEGEVPFPDDDVIASDVRQRAKEFERQGYTRIDLAIDFVDEALQQARVADPAGVGIPEHVPALAQVLCDGASGADDDAEGKSPALIPLATAPRVRRTEVGRDLAPAHVQLSPSVAERRAAATVSAPQAERFERSRDAPEGWIDMRRDIEVGLLPLLAELSRRGIKPVAKFEPVRPAQTHEWSALSDFPVVRLRQRSGATAYEVFLGSDEGLVERAVALASTIEASRSEVDEAAATAEIGRLLGYPGCCADAFAYHDAWATREHYSWARLERRVEVAGPIAPEFNPFMRTLARMYVPCSLRCEATPALVRRELEVTEAVLGPSVAQALREGMQNPWLVLLDGRGPALELRAEGPPSDRFRYVAGRTCGDADVFALVRHADEIALDGERLRLLKRGKWVGDLSARAWVWWHAGVLQAPFWRRVLEIRRYQAEHALGAESADGRGLRRASRGADHRASAPRSHPEAASDVALAAFARLVGHASRWTAPLLPVGSSVELPVAPDGTDVRVRLLHGDTTVELFAAPARSGESSWFRVGPFAFTHSRESRVDTVAQRQLVRAFVAALERFVRAELVPAAKH